MADLLGVQHLRGERGAARHQVAVAALAADKGETVLVGEAEDQSDGELELAAEEDALPGDEDMVEYHEGGPVDAVLRVAQVTVLPGHPAEVARRGLENLGDAGRTVGDGEGEGVVLIALHDVLGGHHQKFVGDARAGHVGLGSAYDDAVFPALHHVDIGVGVGLLAGFEGAVALDVGHHAGDRQVVLLDVFEPVLEILMVMGSLGLVDVVGGGVDGLHGIAADAPGAHTAAVLGGQPAHHLQALEEVVLCHLNVGEPADGLAREVGSRAQHRALRGQLVSKGDGVDVRPGGGELHHVLDLLAEGVEVGLQVLHRLEILFLGHHKRNSPFKLCRKSLRTFSAAVLPI
ncbi:hypothetical protein SDC9_118874 [bioreactor metagenome]|uniref:Uncharacterized protein n=1 Tax=bioreactor metagenome TaxID=1076179 RepID=A0A645C8D2_9ZZZZ